MPITIVSGPDWATIMTAFGTVGAVIAAVWIALASSRKTSKLVREERAQADRRLAQQLDHSDGQLRAQLEHSALLLSDQQEHSDRQLAEQVTSADDRLQQQFFKADELEQRGQAAAVEVIGYRLPPGPDIIDDPQNPSGRPAVIVINKGKYAITNLAVRLSPDGRSIVELWRGQHLVDPAALPPFWAKDMIGLLGEVYGGTIAPGAAMRFEGDDLLVSILRTSYPIVRWLDRWEECWEHSRGQVYPSDMQADWIHVSGSPGA
jgi:hypothetical protein